MGKTILPTRIECGETDVNDKNTVLKIFLCLVVGSLLLGLGIGILMGLL